MQYNGIAMLDDFEDSEAAYSLKEPTTTPLLYRQRVVSTDIFSHFHHRTTTITYPTATSFPTPSDRGNSNRRFRHFCFPVPVPVPVTHQASRIKTTHSY